MQTESGTRARSSDAGHAGALPPLVSRRALAARHALSSVRFCLRSAEILLWTLFFAAAACFLVLRYWLLPNVERYHAEIVAAASTAIGLPVTIGAISADWRGLRPQLELVDVRVHDAAGREALVLPSAVNVVSWRSLAFLDLRLHSFEVDELKLSVRRDAQGGITVAGIRVSGDQADSQLADWILGQSELIVRNAEIEWIDEQRKAPPLKLSQLNFRLRNDGDEHAMGLSARPPPELGSSVELRAELVGHSVAELKAWNGRLYAELGNTDLAAWQPWIDYPLDVTKGEGALRLWVTLLEGKLRRVAADVALANVVAQLGRDLPALHLASVQGRLVGRNTPKGFELATRELRFTDPRGPVMRPTTLRLSIESPAAGVAMRGALTANLLEFTPLAHIAESLPLPPGLRKLLADLAPRGSLHEVRFDWQGELPQPVHYAARARFVELSMRPWQHIPGFAGLAGSIEANEKKGTLYLAARHAQIDLPNVFPEPRLQLDALNGQVGWEFGQGASRLPVKLKLANLAFANADLAGAAFGAYTFTGQGPGVIDLSAQLSRADGRSVRKYLPHAIGEGVRNWLGSAIVAGSASDVRLRLRGDLRDFPFVNRAKGQFEVAAKVSGGILDYIADWPRIEGIEGELLFERDKAEIVGRSGRIFGARLSSVRVSIPRLAGRATAVVISGQAEGPTADFLRYTQQSPVFRMLDGFTDGMQATGRGTLRLKLDLPLADPAKTRLAGQFQFAANNITVDARLPPVERASGALEFAEKSLAVRDVRGTLFGGPVAINGGTRPEGGVLLNARGDATLAGMQSFLDHPWTRFLSGGLSYTASVQVNKQRSARIVLESPLRGLASELPAPLGKAAQDSLPLRVEIVPDDSGDRISLTLGRLLAGELQRRREGDALVVQRAGIGLAQSARLPERSGLIVAGVLPALSLDRWRPLLSGANEAGSGAATFDLKLGTLDAFGKRLNEVTLRAGTDAGGWQANLSATQMAGELTYRGEGRGRLRARLAHFTPPEDAPGAKSAGGAGDLPAVDLIAERFTFRGKQLGRVEIVAQPEGPNWRIEKLANVNSEASLAGTGLWLTGSAARTSLQFTLDINDIGKYFDRIGYPETVKAGSAKLSGRLGWAGDPVNLDYPSLSGELSLEAENGQFLEIEPGIGKLVSLMSLQMLPRRIALDFRDVFSKGFAFDRISSSIHMERGVIHTKDFKMRGPAAEVDIVGDADLARETQNLRVKVMPAFGDSASTIVGLLNPLYGVATMIAQRLLKNPLGHIFAFEYAITGTWSDPKVKKVAVTPIEPPR